MKAAMWGLLRVLFLPMMIFKQIAGLFRMGSRKVGGKKQTRATGRGPTKASLTVRDQEALGEPRTAVRPERDKEAQAGFAPGTVWSGTEIGIPLTNPTDRPYWYRVTVTDLARTEYEIHSPDFGVVDPDDLNRLDPGQTTEFSVFVQGDDSLAYTEPRIFHVHVTQFARESEDAQRDVVQRRRYQWVPAPTPKDMSLEVRPDAVMLRPWREQVELEVEFTNRSYFPCTPTLALVRQDLNGEPLEEEPVVVPAPEPVAPHHRERWECVLEGGKPGDPFLLEASASAAVAGAEDQLGPLENIKSEQPVTVEWVPFLRIWKDWVILLVTILGLLWLFWGIPVWWVNPVVRATLVFPDAEAPGKYPQDVEPQDLTVTLERWDANLNQAVPPVQTARQTKGAGDNAQYDVAWPKGFLDRFYGFRWVWFGGRIGWNGISKRKMRFILKVAGDKASLEAYDLDAVSQGGSDPENPDKAREPHVLDVSKRPVLGRWWITPIQCDLGYKEAVVLQVQFVLSDLMKSNDTEITIIPVVDGTERPAKTQRINQEEGKADKLTILLNEFVPEGQQSMVVLKGSGQPSGKTAQCTLPAVTRRRNQPYLVELDFTKQPDVGHVNVPASTPVPVPFTYTIVDAESGETLDSGASNGEPILAKVPMTKGPERRVRVDISAPGCLPVPPQNVPVQLGQTADCPTWQAIPDQPGVQIPGGQVPGSGQPDDWDRGEEDEGWVPAEAIKAD